MTVRPDRTPRGPPLIHDDIERLEDTEFRAILDALRLKPRYDPRREELAARVVLVPELVGRTTGTHVAPFVSAPGRNRSCDTRF
jgi:hypothetical protein